MLGSPPPRFPCRFPRTLSIRSGAPVSAARATATLTNLGNGGSAIARLGLFRERTLS
jgi:hypothetical protein